jgi:hypothetical protein
MTGKKVTTCRQVCGGDFVVGDAIDDAVGPVGD